MSLELTLVRHGRVDQYKKRICYGQTDMDLDADGVQDACRAGELLKKEKFDAVYVSSLKRTKQTALEILKRNEFAHGLVPIEIEEMKEFNFGHWEGLPYSEIKERYYDEWRKYVSGDRNFKIEGGETFGSFIGRVCRAIDQVCQRHENGNILMVTHFGCISVIIPYLLRCIGNMEWKFAVDPGGISKLQITPDFARLTKLNV